MYKRLSFWLLAIMAVSLLASAIPASAAGKWVLAWWREKGYYENCGGGCLVLHVYTFDENGNALGGIPVYTSWGTFMGNTEPLPKGWIQIEMDTNNDRDARIGQPGVVDSDVTPLMSNAKYPQWGHYSFDCGFMYKSDASEPGEFDTTMNCTVNPRDGTETDIPYTKSLIYYSALCEDWQSDQFWYWADGGVFAQSFVVPEGINRIVGVRPQCAIGGTDQLQYTAEIREGSPTGPLVYSKTSPLIFPYPNWMYLPFGAHACPVTPGQTYYLVLSRPGSLNAAYCNNVYASGQAYQNGTASPTRDLFGFVVGASYETSTTVTSPTLDAGWNLISLPIPPDDPTPAAVFNGIPISGALYRWNPTTDSYVTYLTGDPAGFGDCQSGVGYWLYLSAPATISYQGTPPVGTQHLSLPDGGWRLIGQPIDASSLLASCTVTNVGSAQTLSYYTAATTGWVSGRLWGFDTASGGYGIVGPDPWNASNSLTPWSGYWIWSANLNLTLDVRQL